MAVCSGLVIALGQRIIYKGDMANLSGEGAVVAVNAHQPVGKMYSIDWAAGAMVPVDSSRSYDVALEDGRMIPAVYPSSIGGSFSDKSSRFMLAEGVVGEAEIAALFAGVEAKKASDKAAAAARARAVRNMAASIGMLVWMAGIAGSMFGL